MREESVLSGVADTLMKQEAHVVGVERVLEVGEVGEEEAGPRHLVVPIKNIRVSGRQACVIARLAVPIFGLSEVVAILQAVCQLSENGSMESVSACIQAARNSPRQLSGPAELSASIRCLEARYGQQAS